MEVDQFQEYYSVYGWYFTTYSIQSMFENHIYDNDRKDFIIGFLKQKNNLFKSKKPTSFSEVVALPTLLFIISPHVYKFITSREKIRLPNHSSVKFICLLKYSYKYVKPLTCFNCQ